MALGFTTVKPLGSAQSSPSTATTPSPWSNGALNTPQAAPQSSGFTPEQIGEFLPGGQRYLAPPPVPAVTTPPPPDYASGRKAAEARYGTDLLAAENEEARRRARAEYMDSNYFPGKEKGLRKDYDIGMRGADLDMRGIGIDKNAANRDIAYYTQLLGMMPGYRHLSARDLEIATAEAKRQGNMQRIGIDSAATAGGGWFAPMRGVKNYDSYLGQAAAEDRASVNYYRDQLGLNEKEAGLNRNKAMSGDQLARLDIEAARVGLNREKLTNALEQGLNALGYDKFMNIQDLMALKDSGDVRAAELWWKIVQTGKDIAEGNAGDAYAGYLGP